MFTYIYIAIYIYFEKEEQGKKSRDVYYFLLSGECCNKRGSNLITHPSLLFPPFAEKKCGVIDMI